MTEMQETRSLDMSDASSDSKAQLDRLDSLWEQYLGWLHEYQNVRKQLSETFASGFLSLAQANFSNSSRMRIGQDYYDERMQALRTVSIESADDSWVIEVVSRKNDPEPDGNESPDGQDVDSAEKKEKVQKQGDPLRWFGILVPQALRDSQSSFTQAVGGALPRLAIIAREMRNLEIEIGRLKKSIKKSR